MAVGMKYRAECPKCGKEVTVRKNGRFWHHRSDKPEYPGSPFKRICEGAGQLDTDADDSSHRFP